MFKLGLKKLTYLLIGFLCLSPLACQSGSREPVNENLNFNSDGIKPSPQLEDFDALGEAFGGNVEGDYTVPQDANLEVKVRNVVSGTHQINLTPPHYDQEPNSNTVEIRYEANPTSYDQICFFYGQDWDCRTPSESQSPIYFRTQESVLVQWFAQKDGVRFGEGAQQIDFNVPEPKISQHDATWETDSAAWARYDFDYQAGKKFILISNVGKLYNAKPDAQGNPRGESLSADCTIGAYGHFVRPNGAECPEESVIKTIQEKLGMVNEEGNIIDPSLVFHVYIIEETQASGSYWGQVHSGTIPPTFLVGAYGYQSIHWSNQTYAEFNSPELDSLCEDAFKPLKFRKQTTLRGLRELKVQSAIQMDLEQDQVLACGETGFTSNCQTGDFQVNVVGAYMGLTPKITFSGRDFTGRNVFKSCEHPEQFLAKNWPLKVEISKLTGSNEIEATVRLAQNAPAKGVWPYKKVRIQGIGNGSECDLSEAKADFTSDEEVKIEIGNWGVKCFEFELQYQLIGENEWKTAKVQGNSNRTFRKQSPINQTLTASFDKKGSKEFRIVPRLEFDLDLGSPQCGYIKEAAGFFASGDPYRVNSMSMEGSVKLGKYVESIECECEGCSTSDLGDLNQVEDQNNVTGNLTLLWSGLPKVKKSITLNCSVKGPNQQLIGVGYSNSCQH